MISASDPNDRADQMLAVAHRLIELIRKEAEAMRERRLQGAGADWEEKERLVHAWRLEVQRIRLDPSLIRTADADRRARLAAASRDLEIQLDAHETALAALKEVTEGLVKEIAVEIGAARAAPRGYGANGTLGGGAKLAASGVAVDAKA